MARDQVLELQGQIARLTAALQHSGHNAQSDRVALNRSQAHLKELQNGYAILEESRARVENDLNEERQEHLVCRNALIRHTGDLKPRSGRPRKLTVRDERHILRIARREPRITYRDLIAKSGVAVSHDTIYRLLREAGIINWIAKKRPFLTPEVAGKRYAWALEHEHWTYENWAKVIWSDECSVERGLGKRREWVFLTPDQKWQKDIIQPYKKGKDFSIMLWACFWGMKRSNSSVVTRAGGAGLSMRIAPCTKLVARPICRSVFLLCGGSPLETTVVA